MKNVCEASVKMVWKKLIAKIDWVLLNWLQLWKDSSKIDSFVEAIFTVEILKLPVQHDHIQLFPKVQRWLSFVPWALTPITVSSRRTDFSPNFVIDLTCGFDKVFLHVSAYKFIAVYSSCKFFLIWAAPHEALIRHPTQWGPDTD